MPTVNSVPPAQLGALLLPTGATASVPASRAPAVAVAAASAAASAACAASAAALESVRPGSAPPAGGDRGGSSGGEAQRVSGAAAAAVAAAAQGLAPTRRDADLLAVVRRLERTISGLDISARLCLRDALVSLSNKASNPNLQPTLEQEAMNRAAEYLVLRMLFLSGQQVTGSAPGAPFVPAIVPDPLHGASIPGTDPVPAPCAASAVAPASSSPAPVVPLAQPALPAPSPLHSPISQPLSQEARPSQPIDGAEDSRTSAGVQLLSSPGEKQITGHVVDSPALNEGPPPLGPGAPSGLSATRRQPPPPTLGN
jgi:hypothetical protein